MTDDLIDRLATETKPISPHAMRRRFTRYAGAGIVASIAVVLLFLGIRPDLRAATATPAFWMKISYAALLLLAVLPRLGALARPLPAGLPWLALILLFSGLGALAFVQWDLAPPEQRKMLVWGQSALICPWLIFVISLPMLVLFLTAMRSFAPMHPSLAGFAAGLASGGFGILVYSLHCSESGFAFIALWYTAGILATALLGMIGGRLWLRW